jgi:hypothetical protein
MWGGDTVERGGDREGGGVREKKESKSQEIGKII